MKLLRKLRALCRKRKLDTEMSEEMRLHLELQTERNIAAGMSADEAHYAAQRLFGGVEQIKELARDQRGWVWLDQVRQDVGYAGRMLRKHRGFTFAAVTVLALGIGVNAAVFNLVQTLLFAPAAYVRPAEIVRVISQGKKNPKVQRDFSYPTFLDIRERNNVFADMLAYRLMIVGVGRTGEARRAMAALVSDHYFSTLGVKPARGRAFLPEEEAPGREVPVAIVSHAFWKKRNFEAGLVGSTVQLNRQIFTVVGIMPEGFTGAPHLFATEVWLPLGVHDRLTRDSESRSHALADRAGNSLIVLGRLKSGSTMISAAPVMTALAANLEKAYPSEQRDQTFRLEAPSRFATGGNDRMVAWVGLLLLAMAAIVLLVACLNLASLLLARGTARRKEIAIRLALGGGRARIIRQLVTEGLVLALLGGAAGLIVALWSADVLIASLGKLAPIELAWSTSLNGALIAATFGLSVLATLFFAVGPAFRLSRADVISQLKEHAADEPARRRRKFLPRNPLLVGQLALSLALLTAATLFIRSASRAGNATTGLKAERVFLVELDATLAGLDQQRAHELYRNLSERFVALPGVESASVSVDVPMAGLDLETKVRRLGGVKDGQQETAAKWNGVGTDYFKTMGLPLLRGRGFTTAEATEPGSPPVVIVNEVVAKQFWPGGDALGQRLQFLEGGAGPKPPRTNDASEDDETERARGQTFEVIGIVPATRHNLFESSPDSAIYLPFARGFASHVFFQVRFAMLPPGREGAEADLLRRVVNEVDAALPILSLKTFEQHLESNLQIWIVRAGATLFSVFGALALGLTVVGIYGVVAYAVTRRTREIGIRMALGAGPAAVQGMILREGLVMLASGLSLGWLLAAGIGRVVSSLLYQVSATDPVAMLGAPGLLGAAALLAYWLPARRATKVDPMVALRCE